MKDFILKNQFWIMVVLGWYDIVFLDNAELEDMYKNYDFGYKELVSVSPCLGYVKEENPPVNPVVRWWSIPQE